MRTAIVSLVIILLLNGISFGAVDEAKLGESISKEVEREFTLLKDPVKLSRVESVGYSLARHSSRNDIEYKFKVISKEDINAFSIPGGYVYVFSGMLDFVRTDAELAAVLAHEIAHIEGKHALKQVAEARKMTVYSLAIALATRTAVGVLLPDLLKTAILNKYSREYEQEADLRSIDLLQKAGYNPVAALTVIERLYALSLRKPAQDYGIMMSHPELRERLLYITNQIKNKGIKLDRRNAANYLPVRIGNDGVSIYIEDTPLYKASSHERAIDFASRLDKALKVDLEPFQIRVEGNSLYINSEVIVSSANEEELKSLREKLIKIILDFRVKYMPF